MNIPEEKEEESPAQKRRKINSNSMFKLNTPPKQQKISGLRSPTSPKTTSPPSLNYHYGLPFLTSTFPPDFSAFHTSHFSPSQVAAFQSLYTSGKLKKPSLSLIKGLSPDALVLKMKSSPEYQLGLQDAAREFQYYNNYYYSNEPQSEHYNHMENDVLYDDDDNATQVDDEPSVVVSPLTPEMIAMFRFSEEFQKESKKFVSFLLNHMKQNGIKTLYYYIRNDLVWQV